MSEPKFTKGPWEQDRFGSLNSSDGKVIQVWGLGIAHGPRTQESEANASLLKASTDLYDALSNMLIWASTISSLYPGHKRDGGTVEEDIAAANSALAKALGEKP